MVPPSENKPPLANMPLFDPLNLPSLKFQPRVYGVGAWTAHVFFAYDLVALERPASLVELGTDRGESYFSFCQSVAENRTGTHCFAVDNWKGDAQSGLYEEITFTQVEAHNRMHYAAFSTLLRKSFDAAVTGFEDGKIDILHLDGFHSDDPSGMVWIPGCPRFQPADFCSCMT